MKKTDEALGKSQDQAVIYRQQLESGAVRLVPNAMPIRQRAVVKTRAKISIKTLRAQGYLLLDEVVRALRDCGMYMPGTGRRTIRDLQTRKLIQSPIHTRGLGMYQPNTSWYSPNTVAQVKKIYAHRIFPF